MTALAAALLLFVVSFAPQQASASHDGINAVPIAANNPLDEDNLNGAKLELTLQNGSWNANPNTANFIVHTIFLDTTTTFPGVRVTAASLAGNTLTLTLAYDGTHFIDNGGAQQLYVTALAAAHSGSLDKVSHGLFVSNHWDLPKVTGVDAWAQYNRSGIPIGIGVDFNFHPDTELVKTMRIDMRYRPNSSTPWSDAFNRAADPTGWQSYAFYTNTSHPCPVNLDNPGNRDDIRRKNRECAVASTLPYRGLGEYQVRVIALGPSGPAGRGAGSGTQFDIIDLAGVELAPGVPPDVAVTGTADPGRVRGGFHVSWGHAVDGYKYKVQYVTKAVGNFDDPVEQETGANVQGITVGDLDPKTDYLVRVIAVALFGREGEPSAAKEVRTLGSAPAPGPGPTPRAPRTEQVLLAIYDTDGTSGLSLAEANQAVDDEYRGTPVGSNPSVALTKAELYIILNAYFDQSN